MRPRFQILSLSLLAQILDEAFQLLDDPGVRVHNADAQALLAEAGAAVDRETQVVRIPERIARQALDRAPRAFALFDLDGRPTVHYSGDHVQFDPGSAAISILDSQTQEQRPAVTVDFIRFVQLVETLPQLDAQSTAIICSDVVEEIGDLYRLYLALHFMRKPIITGAFRKDTWWPMKEMLAAVVGGKAQEAAELTRQAMAAGLEPLAIIDHGLKPGMDIVGERFSCGEYFIPHLVLAGRAMQAGMRVLEPEMRRRGEGTSPVGKAVIGTVQGDIHEIGKSLVGIMLTANGFEVHDLGADVPVETFIARVRETGAQVLGLSALLTTTMVVQRRIIQALAQAGLRDRVRVMVGGAPVSRSWADEIGADGYAEDARGAVQEAKRLLAERPAT